MQDDKDKFDRAGALVLGVNPAGPQEHRAYCERKGFGFPILSDPDFAMARAYGAEKAGRVRRTVVVIGPDGRIVFYQAGMPTDDAILEAIG